MPELEDPRKEALAWGLARGLDRATAYREAYGKEPPTALSRYVNRADVLNRIDEIVDYHNAVLFDPEDGRNDVFRPHALPGRPLANRAHECFATAVAAGNDAMNAAIAANLPYDREAALRLSGQRSIRQRIATLRRYTRGYVSGDEILADPPE